MVSFWVVKELKQLTVGRQRSHHTGLNLTISIKSEHFFT